MFDPFALSRSSRHHLVGHNILGERMLWGLHHLFHIHCRLPVRHVRHLPFRPPSPHAPSLSAQHRRHAREKTLGRDKPAETNTPRCPTYFHWTEIRSLPPPFPPAPSTQRSPTPVSLPQIDVPSFLTLFADPFILKTIKNSVSVKDSEDIACGWSRTSVSSGRRD